MTIGWDENLMRLLDLAFDLKAMVIRQGSLNTMFDFVKRWEILEIRMVGDYLGEKEITLAEVREGLDEIKKILECEDGIDVEQLDTVLEAVKQKFIENAVLREKRNSDSTSRDLADASESEEEALLDDIQKECASALAALSDLDCPGEDEDPHDDSLEKEIRMTIILVGNRGGGKSTLGNLLLGEEKFSPSSAGEGQRTDLQVNKGRWLGQEKGRKIRVVEIPILKSLGSSEQMDNFLEKLKGIFKAHSILVVLNASNPDVTEDHLDLLRLCFSMFGIEFIENATVVVTDENRAQDSATEEELAMKYSEKLATHIKELLHLNYKPELPVVFLPSGHVEDNRGELDKLETILRKCGPCPVLETYRSKVELKGLMVSLECILKIVKHFVLTGKYDELYENCGRVATDQPEVMSKLAELKALQESLSVTLEKLDFNMIAEWVEQTGEEVKFSTLSGRRVKEQEEVCNILVKCKKVLSSIRANSDGYPMFTVFEQALTLLDAIFQTEEFHKQKVCPCYIEYFSRKELTKFSKFPLGEQWCKFAETSAPPQKLTE